MATRPDPRARLAAIRIADVGSERSPASPADGFGVCAIWLRAMETDRRASYDRHDDAGIHRCHEEHARQDQRQAAPISSYILLWMIDKYLSSDFHAQIPGLMGASLRTIVRADDQHQSRLNLFRDVPGSLQCICSSRFVAAKERRAIEQLEHVRRRLDRQRMTGKPRPGSNVSGHVTNQFELLLGRSGEQ